MPFCPQCGVENPASARFCDQCGAVLVPVPAQGQATATTTPVPAPRSPAPFAATPVAAGPSSCPQCGTAVIPGEAFCDNCGAALLNAPHAAAAPAPNLPFSGVPPQASYPVPQPVAPTSTRPVTPARPAPPPVAPPPARLVLAPASLIVRASGARLALPATTEAHLGRADPVSNFFPEIDLTPHDAINNGVGRRHARIFIQGGQIYAEDLDSTNGTFRNGARLAPRQSTPLANGDELRLGTLVLAVQL